MPMISTDFGDLIAERMRAEYNALAARWFERLLDLVPVDARDVFPSDKLLDHVPALIVEISAHLRRTDTDAIAANTAILAKARELGALRYAQRASLHQLLREYQLLSGVLVTFVVDEIERLGVVPPPSQTVRLVSRLHHAVDVLAQSTVEAFVALYTETIAEQGQRLEQFTRMAAHEWRQPLSALQFGMSLLSEPTLDEPRRRRTFDAVQRNVKRLVDLTHQLEAVARMNNNSDSPVVQEVSAATVAAEAARQLREMAEARAVDVQIVSATLPTLTVDVGRLELIFVNLISNAIKYSDPAKDSRSIEISGAELADGWARIVVRDNGIGIPEGALKTIFQRFTRAHIDRDDFKATGVGLGLSIVEDCVRSMRGRIDVESTPTVGTTFLLTLPLRADPSGD